MFSDYIYIKDIELFTLLSYFGVNKWYGIKTDVDFENFSQEEQNKVWASLLYKEYLVYSEGVATMSEELSEIMSTLINSDLYFYIRRIYNDTPCMLIYVSESGAVWVERSLTDKDTLKLSYESRENLKEFLSKECFTQDIVTQYDNTPEVVDISFKDIISAELIEELELVTVIEKFNRNDGKMLMRVLVQDKGIRCLLCIQDDSSNKCLDNTADNQGYITELLVR